VTYSNNLEKIETIRDDGLIEGADPTIAALTGKVDVRFADTTLIDLAAGGTPVDLEFAYTALGSREAGTHRVRGLPAEAQAGGRGAGRCAGQLRFPWGEEYCRRAHADGHPHQRPRRNGLRMMHNLLLRLALSSVDVRS
jgi:hypothetical protein